jgi:hypothetical protein
MALDLFKLEKLKVQAFEKDERKTPIGEFEAMFNPASIKQSHGITWSQKGKKKVFHRSEPSLLSLTLVLDGTGVTEMGIVSLFEKSVADRVKEFMTTAFKVTPKIHEPNYLLVMWGDVLRFKCRVLKVDVNYTKFDRSGAALRAELAITFVADVKLEEAAKKIPVSSPDLSHSRVIRAGDTLPLLTSELYGSAASYLEVARYNDIDHFRELVPGRKISFPPLARLQQAGKPETEG